MQRRCLSRPFHLPSSPYTYRQNSLSYTARHKKFPPDSSVILKKAVILFGNFIAIIIHK